MTSLYSLFSRLAQEFHDSKWISWIEKQLCQNSDAMGCSSGKFTAMYQPLHMDPSQLEFTRVVLHTIAGHAGAEDMGRRNMGALRRDVRSSGQNKLTRVCQWRVWKSTEVNIINLEVLGIKLCLIFAIVPSGNKPCSYFAKFGTSKAFISVPGKRAAFWSRSTTRQGGVMRVYYQEE